MEADLIHPNPWNPNLMTGSMMEKERASIREFGFVDPITVRAIDSGRYQIIDGEQRFRAGCHEGMKEFPVIVLDVTEDEARELTIILNDTRGTFQEERLAELVSDLASRRERSRLDTLLPYDPDRISHYIERREIDWEELEKKRNASKREEGDVWVERVYRMPASSASVVDEAIGRIQDEEEVDQDWRALEFMAADFLAR